MDDTGLHASRKHQAIMKIARAMAMFSHQEMTSAGMICLRTMESAGYLKINLPTPQDGQYAFASERMKMVAVTVANPLRPEEADMDIILKLYRNWLFEGNETVHFDTNQAVLEFA